jgi:glycosyltransferase involved in cell wall biosynthesis
MRPILHVLVDPGPDGPARQVGALLPGLAAAGWDNHVALRCEPGRKMPTFAATAHELHAASGLDPRVWLSVRRLIRGLRPAVVHAWGAGATSLVDPVTRWLAGPPLVTTAPSCVPPFSAPPRDATLRELDLPADARIIACVGAMERGHGFREAVWVFDILKYVYPNLWLLAIGAGSQRRRVEEFGRSLGREDFRVRFVVPDSDAVNLLGLAELVWILGDRGGCYVALEALAAGRPVVARQRADLAMLLRDGEQALFVPRADPHELARATRRILDGPPLAQRMHEAALARAAELAPERVARQLAEIYAQLSDTI